MKKLVLLASCLAFVVSAPAMAADPKKADAKVGAPAVSAATAPKPGFPPGLDTNGDGKVSKEEFGKNSAETFKKMDANGDGKATMQEMEKLSANRNPNMPKEMVAKMKEGQQKFFLSMDTDKSGDVSEAEHKAFSESRYTMMDFDKDGSVTLKDMEAQRSAALEKMKQMRAGTKDKPKQ